MWSMPRSVLRVVAGLIALCAAGGFTLGLLRAPPKPRLPGEGLTAAAGAPLTATDAEPLIEAPDAPKPPPEPAEEEKTEEKEPEPEAAPPADQIMPPAPAASPAAAPPADKVGEILETPPAPDEPPH